MIEAQNSPTVPLFTIIAIKYDIEHYLKQRVAHRGHMTWTILRPTVFVDHLIPNFRGEMFATVIKASLKPSRPLVYLTIAANGFLPCMACEAEGEEDEYHDKMAGDIDRETERNASWADEFWKMVGERGTILCEEIEARGSNLLMLVLYIMQACASLFEDYVFSLEF